MEAAAPRGPSRFDFGLLSPEDFEELCFLVVHIDHPDAIRLEDPDGGADCGLSRGGGKFSRCWQAKRFTGEIKWKQCEDSLDRAVSNYEVSEYSFCFARNLTGPQHQRFDERLTARHNGVAVDYWGHGHLEAQLLATEQGQRIANHFYEDRALNTHAFMTALRAGGLPLQTGVDALQRLDAIADFLEANDPYYRYVAVVQEPGQPGPSLTPATIISVDTGRTRIDAVPRNRNTLRHPPEGTLYFEDTPDGRRQLESLNRLLRRGGDLRLDGMRFELRNLPPLFQGMDAGSSVTGTILLSAPKAPIPPWDARFIADTDRGRAEVDVLLAESEPPADWDAALRGMFGGLTVTVAFREGERNEMRTHWFYSYSTEADIRSQARVLAFIDVVHGIGTVAISDKSGVRPTISENLMGRDVDDDGLVWRKFMDSLVVIEDWTGHTFTLLDEIPAEDVRAIIEAATVVRARESSVDWDQTELVMPVEKYEEVFGGSDDHHIAIGYTFGIEVLGEVIWIGELRGKVPSGVEIETKKLLEDGEEVVQVVIRPTTEAARHPVFALFPPGTEFTLVQPDGDDSGTS